MNSRNRLIFERYLIHTSQIWLFSLTWASLSVLSSAYKRSTDPETVENTPDGDNLAVHGGFLPTDDYDQYKNDIDYFLPAFF